MQIGAIPVWPPHRGRSVAMTWLRRWLVAGSRRSCGLLQRMDALSVLPPGVAYLKASGDPNCKSYPSRVLLGEPQTHSLLQDHSIVVLDGPGFYYHHALRKPEIRKEVRRFLRPDPLVVKEAQTAISPARAAGDFLCGVHVRRSDYRHFQRGRYFFSDDEYLRCMEAVRRWQSARSVCFLVVSDERISPRLLAFEGTFRGPGSVYGDFVSLSQCDFIIAPMSTFSEGASFLGDVPIASVENDGSTFDRATSATLGSSEASYAALRASVLAEAAGSGNTDQD